MKICTYLEKSCIENHQWVSTFCIWQALLFVKESICSVFKQLEDIPDLAFFALTKVQPRNTYAECAELLQCLLRFGDVVLTIFHGFEYCFFRLFECLSPRASDRIAFCPQCASVLTEEIAECFDRSVALWSSELEWRKRLATDAVWRKESGEDPDDRKWISLNRT